MAIKESEIISVLMLILISSRLISAIYYESWSVTQFEELKLKHTWMIHNFELITLQDQSKSIIRSSDFWPPGNESFKWYLQLNPQSTRDSSYMSFFLLHNNNDTVHINYTLSMGTTKQLFSYTFVGKKGWGEGNFIKRNEAFKSCLPNGTLIVNCEIRSISKVVQASGKNLVQSTSMKDQTARDKLAKDLLTILEDEKYSDITIVIGEHEIRAHKYILAARSPVFESLLMDNSTLNNTGNSSVIEIKDIKPKIFRKLLQYIYTGKMDDIDSTMAKELLVAAIKYDLNELKATCEEILYNGINTENAIEILELADQYNIPKLELLANKFIAENADIVIRSSGFENLKRSKPNPMYEILRTLLRV